MGYIRLCNINKAYDNKKIFTDYNLEIQDGEFLGIKGASGKGKTTLLNMIGLLESYEGEIFIDNEKVDSNDYKKVRSYLKHRIGYLFQNFALVDDMSVYDNLKIVLGKESKQQMKDKMEKVLQKVNLDKDCLLKKIYTLSGGEQQRVAIARLMLKECDIILADEPTGSLDEANGRKIIELLCDLNKEGKTVIMVSHDDKALFGCSRIVEL